MDEVVRMLGEGSAALSSHWADKIPEESSVGNSDELVKVRHSTIKCSEEQDSTVLYRTLQYGTVQHRVWRSMV